nr:DUF3226 domain-containing protein [Haloferula sp. BvORR071]
MKAEGRFTSGELKRILVTRDADDNPAAAWFSLSGAVNSTFGLAVESPGQWHQVERGPQIAAWLIPAQGSAGMIETLCMRAASGKSQEAFNCLDPFVACLEGWRNTKLHEKERFAYWTICGQSDDPRKRLSLERALDRLDIDWDHKAFASLRQILVEAAS